MLAYFWYQVHLYQVNIIYIYMTSITQATPIMLLTTHRYLNKLIIYPLYARLYNMKKVWETRKMYKEEFRVARKCTEARKA